LYFIRRLKSIDFCDLNEKNIILAWWWGFAAASVFERLKW